MKKYSILLIIFSIFFADINFLNADCENLIKEASKVKVFRTLEFPDPKSSEDSYNSFIGISIENLSENLYAEITNDYNDAKVVVKLEDLVDGEYKYPSPNIRRNVKYTVSIYSNDESCTSKDVIKSFNAETNIFNEYYYTTMCQDNPDLEICQPILDNSDITPTEFENRFKDAIAYRDRTFFQKVIDFIKDYYLYALIPFLIISLVFIIRIVLLRRSGKNE